MTGIDVRLPGGAWTTVPTAEAQALLLKSADFIHHYDLIRTPTNRIEVLDLAIPAFLEAIPRFGPMLRSMDGSDGRPSIDESLAKLSTALKRLPRGVDIWSWPESAKNRDALHDMYWSCRFPSWGPAVITKMLHLKRPRLIPPIDTRLRRAWIIPYREAWTIDQLVDVTFDIGRELGKRSGSLRRVSAWLLGSTRQNR